MKTIVSDSFRIDIIHFKKAFTFVSFLFLTSSIFSQTVFTDKRDYSPGETVKISGVGFHGGDNIVLEIGHIEPNLPDPFHSHESWIISADEQGSFMTSWYVHDQELNTTLSLSAVDQSGNFSSTTFTDAARLDLCNFEITAKNRCAGTQNNSIHYFRLSGTGTIYSVTVENNGSYTEDDISQLKLYVTNSSAFSTNNLLATINSPVNSKFQTFAGINFRAIGINYFWVVMDLSPTATNGHYIKVAPTKTLNVLASVPVYMTGDNAYDGIQTFRVLPTANISGNAVLPPNSSTSLLIDLTGNSPWNLTYSDGMNSIPIVNIPVSPYSLIVSPASNSTYTVTSLNDAYCTGTTMTGRAEIIVNNTPVIITQPISASVVYGEKAVIGISASGVSLSYQWQKSTDSGNTWEDLTGASSETLEIQKSGVLMNKYKYRCMVTDQFNQTVISNPVMVTTIPKQIIIRPTADQMKIFGAEDPVLTFVLESSLVEGDHFEGTLGRVDGENVLDGPYEYKMGSLNAGSNYRLILDGSFKFRILPRPVTITGDQSLKIYGDADPQFTATITSGSIVGNDLPSGELSRVEGENVGEYPIKQGSYSYGSNYAETFIPSTLEIQKRPLTMTSEEKSKIYGDSDPPLTTKITSGSIVGNDLPSGELSRMEGENVGEYPINQGSYTYGNNYAETYIGSFFTILKRPLSIIPDALSKYCGQVDPDLTYKVEGSILNGDLLNVKLYREAGECAGTYEIKSESTDLNDNYLIKCISSVLTINDLSTVEVSQTSSTVQINTPFVLFCRISPAVSGIQIKFILDNGYVIEGTTDATGIAKALFTSAVTEVIKVTALIGDCTSSTDEAYVAIYDPNGGFITGGGWIDSPVGALVGSNMVGKANFGFNSKYERGKNIPSGNTEFQFQAGTLNFSSSVYFLGSLVISGYKATYKGVGSVKGRPETFNFLVSAIDGKIEGSGGFDKFRIKIWNSSGIIYDNNVTNSDENSLPATALSGGSIMIHSPDNRKSAEMGVTYTAEEISNSIIFIPKGFSPNGDGINDNFRIKYLENYPDAKLNVYSPGGNILYQQEHYGNINFWRSEDAAWWNGCTGNSNSSYSNKLSSGSYVYILELKNGTENLIRSGIVFISK